MPHRAAGHITTPNLPSIPSTTPLQQPLCDQPNHLLTTPAPTPVAPSSKVQHLLDKYQHKPSPVAHATQTQAPPISHASN